MKLSNAQRIVLQRMAAGEPVDWRLWGGMKYHLGVDSVLPATINALWNRGLVCDGDRFPPLAGEYVITAAGLAALEE